MSSETYAMEDSTILDSHSQLQIVVDEPLATRGPESSSKSMKRRPQRGLSFTSADDELLCKCWLETSQNATVVGNEQKDTSFYDRVTNLFNEYNSPLKPRTSSSIHHRWLKINKAVSKFRGYLSQIEARQQNGATYQDKFEEARRMYAQFDNNKPFPYEPCWRLLHNSLKWIAYVDSSSAPSTPVSDGDHEHGKEKQILPQRRKKEPESRPVQDQLTPDQQPMVDQPTPLEASFAGTSAKRADVISMIKVIGERSKECLDLFKEMIRKQEERREVESKQKEIERANKNAFMAKQLEFVSFQLETQKNAEDERVLAKSLNNLNDYERQYYEDRKREILARRLNGINKLDMRYWSQSSSKVFMENKVKIKSDNVTIREQEPSKLGGLVVAADGGWRILMPAFLVGLHAKSFYLKFLCKDTKNAFKKWCKGCKL